MAQGRTLFAAMLLTFAVGCARNTVDSRGPVDRSVDAAETTVETTGSSARSITASAGEIAVAAVTFPFRLIGNLFNAIF